MTRRLLIALLVKKSALGFGGGSKNVKKQRFCECITLTARLPRKSFLRRFVEDVTDNGNFFFLFLNFDAVHKN